MALVVAAITCPCHIALLPALAAGTALGAVVQAHVGWLFAGATLVFLGALTIAFRRPLEGAGVACGDGECGGERTHCDLMDRPGDTREESWQAAAR